MRVSTHIRIFFGLTVATLLFSATFVLAQTTLSSNVSVTDMVHVAGTLSKGSGTFVIDHPLDPKNKLLYHSFVESPDVKNLYDGVVELDREGKAIIVMPDYFAPLNRDFRYFATPVGGPMPNLHVSSELQSRLFWFGLIERHTFVIAGGVPGGEVSWQVSGIRQDIFIEENPIITEVAKGPEELVNAGECLFEELCQ